MKQKKKEKEIANTNVKANPNLIKNSSEMMIKEIFLSVFVVLSVILGLTLYFYYKVNLSFEEEFATMKDVHHLKANIFPYAGSNVKGFIELSDSFEGINIIGKIEGLAPGSTHYIHVLEYSDISELDPSKVAIAKDLLKHYNPSNSPHACPSNNKDDTKYHEGDMGNVIANNEGHGFISITRKSSIKSLNGRMIVIGKISDSCEKSIEYDDPKDIIGYGLLNAVKPNIPLPINYSTDYLMRELNSASKKEFDNKHSMNDVTLNHSKNNINQPQIFHTNKPSSNLQIQKEKIVKFPKSNFRVNSMGDGEDSNKINKNLIISNSHDKDNSITEIHKPQFKDHFEVIPKKESPHKKSLSSFKFDPHVFPIPQVMSWEKFSHNTDEDSDLKNKNQSKFSHPEYKSYNALSSHVIQEPKVMRKTNYNTNYHQGKDVNKNFLNIPSYKPSYNPQQDYISEDNEKDKFQKNMKNLMEEFTSTHPNTRNNINSDQHSDFNSNIFSNPKRGLIDPPSISLSQLEAKNSKKKDFLNRNKNILNV